MCVCVFCVAGGSCFRSPSFQYFFLCVMDNIKHHFKAERTISFYNNWIELEGIIVNRKGVKKVSFIRDHIYMRHNKSYNTHIFFLIVRAIHQIHE